MLKATGFSLPVPRVIVLLAPYPWVPAVWLPMRAVYWEQPLLSVSNCTRPRLGFRLQMNMAMTMAATRKRVAVLMLAT
jgi:hypothetical protein